MFIFDLLHLFIGVPEWNLYETWSADAQIYLEHQHESDWSTRWIDGNYLAIEAQSHQTNWPPMDIFRWKLLKSCRIVLLISVDKVFIVETL